MWNIHQTVAKFNKTTGDVYDLDGKRLYNINDLEMGSGVEDDIQTEDFDNIDYEAENEEIAKQDKTEDKAEEKSFIAKYLVWIIIGGGVLLIIVAAVVVIIIISAKKKKAAATTDELPETAEENETINE